MKLIITLNDVPVCSTEQVIKATRQTLIKDIMAKYYLPNNIVFSQSFSKSRFMNKDNPTIVQDIAISIGFTYGESIYGC